MLTLAFLSWFSSKIIASRTATTSADRLYSNIILYRIKVIMVKVIIKIGWSWPFTSITVPELSHLLGVGHFGSGRHQLPTFVVAEYVRWGVLLIAQTYIHCIFLFPPCVTPLVESIRKFRDPVDNENASRIVLPNTTSEGVREEVSLNSFWLHCINFLQIE